MPLLQPGQETALPEPGSSFQRHHHVRPYAALVVDGSCEEAGDRGRFRAQAGDVLLHRAFDGHSDRIGAGGAVFINFPLDDEMAFARGKVSDVDAIVRAYERDAVEASEMFREQLGGCAPDYHDWPDLLARDLAKRSLEISQWASTNGLHPASVSRGFRLAYGMSPKRFRLEHRASAAARALATSRATGTEVAAETGFADQAHMTRTIQSLFGLTPGQLQKLS